MKNKLKDILKLSLFTIIPIIVFIFVSGSIDNNLINYDKKHPVSIEVLDNTYSQYQTAGKYPIIYESPVLILRDINTEAVFDMRVSYAEAYSYPKDYKGNLYLSQRDMGYKDQDSPAFYIIKMCLEILSGILIAVFCGYFLVILFDNNYDYESSMMT